MLKRLIDVWCSGFGLMILSPLFIIISLMIIFDSRGGIFYKQIRVGKGNVDFNILKFRSMRKDSHHKGLLTIGGTDSRITAVGRFIRKYKLDELPQLINVLLGSMSLVGPRPEVRKYVDLYNEEQKKVLSVKPGITDFASIIYRNETEILAKTDNPEELYIQEIMPAKLKLNLKYLEKRSNKTDLNIIFKTISKISN